MTRPGMGRGLAAILPDTPDRGVGAAPVAGGVDSSQPAPAANAFRPRLDQDAGRVSGRRGRHPAADRSPAARRSLRADRRRTPLAGGSGGRPADGARDRQGRGRAGAPPDGADREHGARGPQSGRRGPRLRGAGRGSGAQQGGAGATAGPQPPVDLEPDPPPRSSRRSARPAGAEASSARATAGRSSRPRATRPVAASLARPRHAAGPSARPSAAPRRWTRASGPKVVPHPDQEAALVRAEEALESALGTGVRVRPARRGIRAELHFDDLDQLLAFARERGPGG